MNKLWIFGHSFSLPFNLPNESLGWPSILSRELSLEVKNLAQPASDNLFIYHAYDSVKTEIAEKDVVIIGWSHPSRKSFVLDEMNPTHVEVAQQGYIYTTQTYNFFRSKNAINKNLNTWVNFKPNKQGLQFFDIWFRDYYSLHEQTLNFQAYLDSVESSCTGRYLPFYFSQESIKDVSVSCPGAGSMVEFILENKVSFSDTDLHMNENGHKLWAEKLRNILNDLTLT